MALHLNTVTLIGRISKAGPTLRYSENGTPVCSMVVEVDEFGPGGKVYTSYIPVDIAGKYAEPTSMELEAGDIVQISGKLKFKSSLDKHTAQKVSKMIVSSWGIAQRQPSPAGVDHVETSGNAEPGELSVDTEQSHEAERRPRKRQYPKAALEGGFQN